MSARTQHPENEAGDACAFNGGELSERPALAVKPWCLWRSSQQQSVSRPAAPQTVGPSSLQAVSITHSPLCRSHPDPLPSPPLPRDNTAHWERTLYMINLELPFVELAKSKQLSRSTNQYKCTYYFHTLIYSCVVSDHTLLKFAKVKKTKTKEHRHLQPVYKPQNLHLTDALFTIKKEIFL